MEHKTVFWKDLITSSDFTDTSHPLVVPLGTTETGAETLVDLHLLRNLLICGVADSGKTALVHSILNSLLVTNGPDKLRLMIVDPKMVEFQPYDELAHLLTPVITDAKKALLALKWLSKEADRRLQVLRKHKVRNIEEYHEKVLKKKGAEKPDEYIETMPYIVTVLDDLSLLMAQYHREFSAAISMLVPNAKASGIHLLVTATRFDAQTIPVILREHFAARIAFHMPGAQSRLLMGDASAEALGERGAAVYRANSMHTPIAIQSALITDDEIDAHAETLARKYPKEEIALGSVPSDMYFTSRSETKSASIFDAMDEEVDDDKFQEAVEAVREAGMASTSYLQRKLGIGYSRAARLIDILEEQGIIGPGDGAKPREVL